MENLLSTLKLELIIANWHDCDKTWDHRDVYDNFARIYYITDGLGYAEHGGQRYCLRPGNLYLLPAYNLINVYCPKYMRQFYIHCRAEILNGLNFFDFFEFKYQLPAPEGSYLSSMIMRFAKIDHENHYKYKIEQDAILKILNSAFIEPLVLKQSEQRFEGVLRLKKTLDYIEKNLNQTITLEKLARLEGLQTTYFSNLFSRLFGVPLIRYINTRRVEKIQELLFNSNKNLTEIAMLTGFSDAFYLSKMFKKFTGLSPEKYRKQKELKII
jgi:AraC-like DNA-binding protein